MHLANTVHGHRTVHTETYSLNLHVIGDEMNDVELETELERMKELERHEEREWEGENKKERKKE